MWLGRSVALTIVLGCGPSTPGAAERGTTSDGDTTHGATQSSGVGTAASTTVAGTTATSSTSTTTNASTSDDALDTSGAESIGYIIDPDGGCVSLTCDVWAQDCAPGEKCLPWSPGGDGAPGNCAGARCSEVDRDPKAPGEPCTAAAPWSGIDDCEIGAYCWNVDARTHEGICVAQCIGSEAQPACEDASLSCFQLEHTSVTACVAECDPLAPDCGPDGSCVFSAGNDQGPLCVSHDLQVPTGIGTECLPELGCGDGFACLTGSSLDSCASDWCCAALCDLSAPACVGENTECVSIPPALDPIGACVAAR